MVHPTAANEKSSFDLAGRGSAARTAAETDAVAARPGSPDAPWRAHGVAFAFNAALVLGLTIPVVLPLAQTGPARQPPPIERPTPAPPTPTGIAPIDDALSIIGDWIDRANREYRDVVERELRVPTEKALEAERARQQPPALTRPVEPARPAQAAVPAEPKVAAPAPTSDQASVGNTDEATRARQRAAEEARTKAAAGPAAGQSATVPPATPVRPPVTTARPEETTPDDARLRAEAQRKRDEEARREAERMEVERRDAERRTAERAAADKRDAERKEAERRESERKAAAERLAAEKRDNERKEAERKEAERKAAEAARQPSPVAPAPPPVSPGELAEEASKAGTAALRKIEEQFERARKAASSGTRSGTDKSSRDAAPAGRSGLGEDVAARADPGAGEPTNTRRSRTAKTSPRCRTAGRTIDPPGTYVVKRGDTLWRIARIHYDRGIRYKRIVRANASKLSDPDLIFPCQRFFLPALQRAQLINELFAAETGAAAKLSTWNGVIPDTFSAAADQAAPRVAERTILSHADRISAARP